MRVVLLEEVFGDDDISPLELLGIIAFGYHGRHQILIEPLLVDAPHEEKHPNLSVWLAELPDGLQDEILQTFRHATEALSESRAKDIIEVGAISASDWDTSPPVLTVADARRLLGHSLHLLVENARNDGMFLEGMIRRLLGPGFWEPIEEALEEKWASFEHGGGLSGIENAVEDLADKPIERVRTWAMFDSDAAEPDHPSDQSESVRQLCEESRIDHHQLWRRAMENYLPKKALSKAADSNSSKFVKVERDKATAFFSLSEQQRHHFHMKNGFSEEQVYEPPEFYKGVDQEDLEALEGGFGRKIGDLFGSSSLGRWDEWFRKEFSKEDEEEFQQIFDQIYRKL